MPAIREELDVTFIVSVCVKKRIKWTAILYWHRYSFTLTMRMLDAKKSHHRRKNTITTHYSLSSSDLSLTGFIMLLGATDHATNFWGRSLQLTHLSLPPITASDVPAEDYKMLSIINRSQSGEISTRRYHFLARQCTPHPPHKPSFLLTAFKCYL